MIGIACSVKVGIFEIDFITADCFIRYAIKIS